MPPGCCPIGKYPFKTIRSDLLSHSSNRSDPGNTPRVDPSEASPPNGNNYNPEFGGPQSLFFRAQSRKKRVLLCIGLFAGREDLSMAVTPAFASGPDCGAANPGCRRLSAGVSQSPRAPHITEKSTPRGAVASPSEFSGASRIRLKGRLHGRKPHGSEGARVLRVAPLLSRLSLGS